METEANQWKKSSSLSEVTSVGPPPQPQAEFALTEMEHKLPFLGLLAVLSDLSNKRK